MTDLVLLDSCQHGDTLNHGDCQCSCHLPVPVLVHSGTYALYLTPGGGRHLVYRRLTESAEDGSLVELPEPADAHLPDIPAEAIPLIENFLAHGLPPAVLAMLGGKLSPLAVMKALRNGADDGPG